MDDDKLLKRRVEFSEILLKEAMPFMTGQPRVWARQFGEKVTFGETFGKVLAARVPGGTSGFRHDVLVFHDIPTREGLLHVVQLYTGGGLTPSDFLITLPINIPEAVWVKRGLLDNKWTSVLAERKLPDPFCDFLEADRKSARSGVKIPIDYGDDWSYSRGNTTIRLAYTLQLMPNGKGETVVELRRPFRIGWTTKDMKFQVAFFMELVALLKTTLARYPMPAPQNAAGSSTEPAPMKIPVASECLLAVPEFAPLIEDKGAEIPWPALPAYMAALGSAPAQAPAAASQAAPAFQPGSAQAEKYCMHCGKKIPASAKFCPHCGGNQS